MADTDEVTSQVEAGNQSHANEKPSELTASENIASVVSQGAVLSPPQQQQQLQVPSSTQINASITGNASPQLFQVQQLPGQAPQTMALINGQLVPVSAIPVQVPSGAPVPAVVPQVQVQVQSQSTAVTMRASIVQTQPSNPNTTSTATQERTNVPESKQEKTGIASNAPPPTTIQSKTNTNASPATQKTRNRGCGCGFWAAIMSPFQQRSQPQRNDDNNKDNRDNNGNATANNDTQDDNTTNQSLGTTAVNMAVQGMNPAPAPAPAAQGDPLQSSRDIAAGDVGPNTTATYYPLGANDINTVNAMNNQVYNQGFYTGPPGQITPDTGQYLVPVQQPSNVVDSSHVAPAYDPGQTTGQVAADGANVDTGDIGEEEEDDLVDDGFDDGVEEF
jgi:hypothetical protein